MKSQLKNFRRFREELNYCYEKIPFYGKKMQEFNLTPGDLNRLNELYKLPFTDKKDYRKNFPMGVLAKDYKLNDEGLTRSQSSGTTGERVTTFELGVLLSQRAVHCTAAHRLIEKTFAKKDRKICRYAAPNCSDVECANPHSTMHDRLLSDGTLVLPVYHDLLTTSEELINRAIEEVLSYQPDLYYVDPTHFSFLLRESKKRGVELPTAPVVSSYSMATLVSKRQICEFIPLDSHFSELLSSSEMGWIAMTCPHGKLHLNEDSYFFEFVREGVSVRAGEFGEMCISSLDQGAMPHLRYQTGDWFFIEPTRCDCGHPSTCVVTEGRDTQLALDDNIESELKTLSPRSLDNAIGAPYWLEQYQLARRNKNDFLLQFMVNEHYGFGDNKFIKEALAKILPKDCNLSCERVDYIPCDRSGKFQILQLTQCQNKG